MRDHYLIIPWIWVITMGPVAILANQDQYHIQTDEGPERYFRYLTLSGQYRKEKRLEDGTVIGTYGWVDADGMLRLKDYIADNEGYRILKNRNIYVGKETPMSVALKAAKNAPSNGGFIGDARYNNAITKNVIDYKVLPTSSSYLPPTSTSYLPPTSTSYLPPTPYYSQSTPKPSVPYYPSTSYGEPISPGINTPSATSVPSTVTHIFNAVPKTPNVQILPNSIPSSTQSPLEATFSQIPSSTIEPPYHLPTSTLAPPTEYGSTTPTTVHITSSSVSKTTVSSSEQSSTVIPFVSTTQTSRSFTQNNETSVVYNSTPTPFISTTYLPSSPNVRPYEAPSTIPTPIASNSLDTSDYSGSPQYEHYDNYRERIENPYVYQNGPTYPIDQNGRIFTGSSNNRKYSPYDGVAITNDGFRYYLPRQYHEEHSPPGENNKIGSFGYIDPFGIRRVIYYNADPEKGFLHRKNNRYVGFDATPYDPRPA